MPIRDPGAENIPSLLRFRERAVPEQVPGTDSGKVQDPELQGVMVGASEERRPGIPGPEIAPDLVPDDIADDLRAVEAFQIAAPEGDFINEFPRQTLDRGDDFRLFPGSGDTWRPCPSLQDSLYKSCSLRPGRDSRLYTVPQEPLQQSI